MMNKSTLTLKGGKKSVKCSMWYQREAQWIFPGFLLLELRDEQSVMGQSICLFTSARQSCSAPRSHSTAAHWAHPNSPPQVWITWRPATTSLHIQPAQKKSAQTRTRAGRETGQRGGKVNEAQSHSASEKKSLNTPMLRYLSDVRPSVHLQSRNLQMSHLLSNLPPRSQLNSGSIKILEDCDKMSFFNVLIFPRKSFYFLQKASTDC